MKLIPVGDRVSRSCRHTALIFRVRQTTARPHGFTAFALLLNRHLGNFIMAVVSFLVKLYHARSAIRKLRRQGLVRFFVWHPDQMYETADA